MPGLVVVAERFQFFHVYLLDVGFGFLEAEYVGIYFGGPFGEAFF